LIITRASNESGQSLIEFAVASTLFLLMFFGILDFGIGIWRYNMVADLAQEGVRWASVRGSTCTAPCVPSNPAGVQTFVQGRAPGFSVSVTTTPGTPWVPGTIINVTVSSAYEPFSGAVPQLAMTFQHTASMTVSR